MKVSHFLNEKNILRALFVNGVLVLSISTILTIKTSKPPIYSNHSNLKSTIIALELSSKASHIHDILGGPEDEKHTGYIEIYKNSLAWDAVYIVSYLIFFSFLFELAIRYANETNLYRIFFYIALITAVLFDFLENYKILQVLSAKSDDSIAKNLLNLKEFSLVKWVALFLSTSITGLLFWISDKEIILKVSSFFLFPTFFLSIIGIQKLKLIEVSLILLTIGLVIIFIYIAKETFYSFRK